MNIQTIETSRIGGSSLPKRSSLLGLAAVLVVPLHAEVDHYVPAEKNLPRDWNQGIYQNAGQKVYKGEELYTIGMPVGGICAGQLYVRGDGTLANWWIANNAHNTGYGINHLLNFDTKLGPWKVCYQTFKPASYIDQGFGIEVKSADGKVQRKELSEKDFDAIEFVGEYPLATIQYKDAEAFPVSVSSQVFSPFIPLNAKDSAMPLTLLKYTVENTGKKDVSVSLGGWLQNLVCQELKNEVTALSRNTVVKRKDGISVVFDLVPDTNLPKAVTKGIADFSSYDGWTVEGEAFGNKPSSGSVGVQAKVHGNVGTFVNSFQPNDQSTGKMTSKPFEVSKDFINFRIGGGHHPRKACLNLFVDGKVVRSATGKNRENLELASWSVSEFKGKKATLEIVDQVKGGWGHILVDEIELSNIPPVKPFPADHPYFGNVSLTLMGDGKGAASIKGDASAVGATFSGTSLAQAKLGKPLVGGVQSDFVLKAGQSRTVTFALSWYFPNRRTQPGRATGDWSAPIPTQGVLVGQMYDNWFDSSQDVVSYYSKNSKRLEQETYDFHQSYYGDTNLPYWLSNRLLMPLSILASETCQWWKNGRFWAFEGVGSCHGTCTHVWNYEHAMARFFPELERYMRYATDQTKELITDYGVEFIQFDGEWDAIYTHEIGSKWYRDLRKVSKDVILSSRIDIARRVAGNHVAWAGDKYAGDYQEREKVVNHGNDVIEWADHPWQAWCTIDSTQWSWNNTPRLYSSDYLIKEMVRTIGSNGNYMINVAPSPEGDFSPEQIKIMNAFGSWAKARSEAIYGTRGGPWYPDANYVSTRKGRLAYLFIESIPGDKKLTVAGLEQQVVSVKLLPVKGQSGKQTNLSFEQEKDVIRFDLSGIEPQPLFTILKIEFDAPVEMSRFKELPNIFERSGDKLVTDGFDLKFSSLSEQYHPKGDVNLLLDPRSERKDYVFHTNQELRPFVQIDLQKVRDVTGVLIKNRPGQFGARAKNLSVKISVDGKQWKTVHQAQNQSREHWLIPVSQKHMGADVRGVKTRYIKIFLDQDEPEYFHLPSIKVYYQ